MTTALSCNMRSIDNHLFVIHFIHFNSYFMPFLQVLVVSVCEDFDIFQCLFIKILTINL